MHEAQRPEMCSPFILDLATAMRKRLSQSLVGWSVLLLTLFVWSCGAHAQMGSPLGGCPGGPGGPDGPSTANCAAAVAAHRHASAGQTQGLPDAADLAQAQMDALHDGLRLRDDQMPLWRDFSETLNRVIDDERRWERRARASYAATSQAPQAMDTSLDALQNRITALEDVVQLAKHLYASLDAQQKNVADQHMNMIVMTLAGGRAPGPQPDIYRQAMPKSP